MTTSVELKCLQSQEFSLPSLTPALKQGKWVYPRAAPKDI